MTAPIEPGPAAEVASLDLRAPAARQATAAAGGRRERRGARARHRLALVLDPRFPGGTSAAAAAEIRALAGRVELSVHALDTAMFRGRPVHPAIELALDAHGLVLDWDAPVVRADTIVFHNPSCLRFDRAVRPRLSCATAIVVTHENFLRPNGAEAFDVGGCLARLEAALICARRALAPVGAYNRRTVEAWCNDDGGRWEVTAVDWFNILDATPIPPTSQPRDRRGRHSRPGFEKFPSLAVMQAHFPAHAAACRILGGDGFLLEPTRLPAHWDVRPFGATPVARFLEELDVFVYFTNPLWRESFGRVIAEAIAAGKLVITDPGTAESFGPAVVACDGWDVDARIDDFLSSPRRYVDFVEAAQGELARFRPERFVEQVRSCLEMFEADDRAVV